MKADYQISIHTLVFIGIFLLSYLVLLVRNTIKHKIDLFDLFLLSTVAIIPALFTFFTEFAFSVSGLIGVTFPFVVLFGALFFVVFLYLYRLVLKINHIHHTNIRLTQEIAILRRRLEEVEKVRKIN